MDRWLRRSARVAVLVGMIGLVGVGAGTVRLVRTETAQAAVATRFARTVSHRPSRGLTAATTPTPPQPEAMAPAPPASSAPTPAPAPVWTYADTAVPDPVVGRSEKAAPAAAVATAGGERPVPKGERIPVLMYHEIGDKDNSLYVSRSDFEAQVKWLSDNGFHTVTLGEVYHHLHDGQSLPAKPIVLSFDDGYQTFAEIVVPVLKPYKFRATTFIITGSVGHREFMTWEQVKALPEAGMEIGSHTVNHLDLRTLSAARLKQELEDSKKELEEQTGVKVEVFCYPSGRYNDAVVAAAKAAGYLASVTTDYGPVTPDEPDQLWSRIRISRGEGIKAFASKVNQASGL